MTEPVKLIDMLELESFCAAVHAAFGLQLEHGQDRLIPGQVLCSGSVARRLREAVR